MNKSAWTLNRTYLAQLAGDGLTFGRIRDFWWTPFRQHFDSDWEGALNALDLSMNQGQMLLASAASDYAKQRGFRRGSAEHIQRVNQVLKSSTGKMFERFIGLAIAYALIEHNLPFAVCGFNKRSGLISESLDRNRFVVEVDLAQSRYTTPIDADLLIFDPRAPADPVYLVSVKSTLKNRFHNVAFWNLLRLSALADVEVEKFRVSDRSRLENLYYISVCSDLAKEQPDFGSETGARNLLCFDAALLDAAFVTASRARGLERADNRIGSERAAPFAPLSMLISHLRERAV